MEEQYNCFISFLYPKPSKWECNSQDILQYYVKIWDKSKLRNKKTSDKNQTNASNLSAS